MLIQYSVEDLRQSGAMKEIDNELALLDLASRSFLAEVNTRILRLKSRQSALSAMHRLPVELLVKIFRSVSSPISIGELLSDELIPLEDLETPHVLSSACKAWKAVCESTLTYGPWLTPVNGRRDGENH